MTETPSTPPKTKAEQLAELLGVQLLPWQAALLNAYLTEGVRTVHAGGRQNGRSTVRALADLVEALRTPPAPEAPLSWVLGEGAERSLTAPFVSLPAMLTPHDSPDPRLYSDYANTDEGDDWFTASWADKGITAACGAILDTYPEYAAGHVPACSICSAQPLVTDTDTH